jgi:hypothetical protein
MLTRTTFILSALLAATATAASAQSDFAPKPLDRYVDRSARMHRAPVWNTRPVRLYAAPRRAVRDRNTTAPDIGH